jgi:hypothetical protein
MNLVGQDALEDDEFEINSLDPNPIRILTGRAQKAQSNSH